MKYAADFRKIARDALRGRWGIAVIAGIIASLIGSAGDIGPEIHFNLENGSGNFSFDCFGRTIFSTGSGLSPEIRAFVIGSAIYIFVAAVVLGLLFLVLSSVVDVGYARFHLSLVDRDRAGIEQLFQYFPHWKNTACTKILRGLYVFLWSLVFFIPGIVASYGYSMTDFILAEHPEMTAGEALAASKEMMMGNKWRLFCLHMSFFGWAFLCLFTFGIGNLWLEPYKKTSMAAFYREVSGTEKMVSEQYEEVIPV